MIESEARRIGEETAIGILFDEITKEMDTGHRERPKIKIPELDLDRLINKATMDYSKIYGSHELFEKRLKTEYLNGFLSICSKYHFEIVGSLT